MPRTCMAQIQPPDAATVVRARHVGMGAIIVAGDVAGLVAMGDALGPTGATIDEGTVRGGDMMAQSDGDGSADYMTVAALQAQNEAERYEAAAGAIYRDAKAFEVSVQSRPPGDPAAARQAVETMRDLAASAETYADTLRASAHDGRISESESLDIQEAKDDIARVDAVAHAAYLGMQSDDLRPAADALASAQYRLSTVDGPPLSMIRSKAALAESKAELDRAAERLAESKAELDRAAERLAAAEAKLQRP